MWQLLSLMEIIFSINSSKTDAFLHPCEMKENILTCIPDDVFRYRRWTGGVCKTPPALQSLCISAFQPLDGMRGGD